MVWFCNVEHAILTFLLVQQFVDRKYLRKIQGKLVVYDTRDLLLLHLNSVKAGRIS